MKFNELPAGNYSHWDHGHSTPISLDHILHSYRYSTDKITVSSSLSSNAIPDSC